MERIQRGMGRVPAPTERAVYLFTGALVLLTCVMLAIVVVMWRQRPLSAGETVRRAYLAANAGNYSEANRALSTEMIQALNSPLGLWSGGSKGMWDRITRGGQIERVEIVETTVRGEGGTVHLRVFYRAGARPLTADDPGGNPREAIETVVREGGRWRLGLGGVGQ